MLWTPRKLPLMDIMADGKARRSDRKRLRANMQLITKYDPERAEPDEDDYESSDIETDYKEHEATRRKIDGGEGRAEAVEELRARRTRVSKKSDAIKLHLGKNVVSDAVYFVKVESLHVNGNYRAALDHIETQETRINDDRLQEHGKAEAPVFWDIVKQYMTKAYTMNYTEALAEDARSGLAQKPGEDVDAYAVRARGLRKAVKAFMKMEECAPREASAFKVKFNKSWIDGLTTKGNLQVAHMTAVKRGKPLKFEEIRAEASAIEQCTGPSVKTEHIHTRRAPANAASPGRHRGELSAGAPANAAPPWKGEEEEGYGYDHDRTPGESVADWAEAREDNGTEYPAVAKLAEQVGMLQEALNGGGQTGKGGKGGAPQQGYPGQTGKGGKGGTPQHGYPGQAGKGGKGGYQGQTGKGGKGGFPGFAGKGGKGGKGGWTQPSYPNEAGPHTAQSGGPATPSSQGWQTTTQVRGPPPPMPTGAPMPPTWAHMPTEAPMPPTGAPMPATWAHMPATWAHMPPETCMVCVRDGLDPHHEYKDCANYVGCGICKGKGHYGKECTSPCHGCGQAGMIGYRRHAAGCHLLPHRRPRQW